MPLESGTYISDLVLTNPVHTDGLSQADSHLRLIKAALQATFPNVKGPVTPGQTDLSNGYVPLGGIIMWTPAMGAIPAHWHLCDGSTLTIGGSSVTLPDLRDKFIVGAGNTYVAGATGGSSTQTGTTDSQGSHNHTGSDGAHALTIAELPSHTHAPTLNDPSHRHSYEHGSSSGGGAPNTGGGSAGVNQTDYTDFAGTGITLSIGYTGSGNAHSHTISTDGAHTHNVTTTGLPPYVALAYIVRVS